MKKRKLLISLLTVACASCFAIGLAACDLTTQKVDPPGGGINGQGTIDEPYVKPEPVEEVKLDYIKNDGGTYTITGIGDETKEDIVIPSKINDIDVTEIGDFAFNGHNGMDKQLVIKSVTIPETIKVIGESAFSNCTGIQSIRIPNTVTTVGQSAFQNCTSLIGVVFGEKMTAISNSMFDGCESLRTISIPDNITSIGEESFRSCTNLINIDMGKGVLNIGYRAFFGCTGLKKVEVGESVTTLGESVFESCTSLESIVIPNSVRFMGIRLLADCQKSIKSISIPYVGAFRYNDVPDHLKPSENPDEEEESKPGSGNSKDAIDIKDPRTYGHFGYLFGATSNYDNREATQNLLSDVTVTITGSAPITNGSFNDIWGVKTVIIKEGLTEIMEQGLAFMWNLETLVVPKSLRTVGDSVFYGTSTLKTVYYGGASSADWSGIYISPENGNNDVFKNSKRYYYSETPQSNFWHYDSNGLPLLWS